MANDKQLKAAEAERFKASEAERFRKAAEKEGQKWERGLTDDEVEEVFRELVRAKIMDIVQTSGRMPQDSASKGPNVKEDKVPDEGARGGATEDDRMEEASRRESSKGLGTAKGDDEVRSGKKSEKSQCTGDNENGEAEIKALKKALQITPGDWDWLNDHVRTQLKEAIDTKHDPPFVLLTPQGYVDWWNALSQAVIGTSALGAGFTFTIIFSELAAPRSGVSKDYVRGCLIASWMLFVMSVAWASFASVILAVNKIHVLNALASGKKWFENFVLRAVTTTVLLQMMMPVGAFLAATEAVRSYHNDLGIASFVLIGLIGTLMLLGWIMQNFFFSGPGKLEKRLARSEKWRGRFGVYRETANSYLPQGSTSCS